MFVIDALVHNVSDLQLQQALFALKNEDLKLTKVVDLIQVAEAGRSQLREIQSCHSRLGTISKSKSNCAHVHATTAHHQKRRSQSNSPARSPARSKHQSRRRDQTPSRSPGRSPSQSSQSSRNSRKSNAKTYTARSPTPAKRNPVSSGSDTDDECDNCGRSHGSDWCPAKNRLCHACGKKGHFAFKCRR